MTGRCVCGILQSNNPLGQGAGLVRAEHVHAAKILNRIESSDDDPLLGHCPGAGGQRHADNRGEKFWRQADRERNRKEQRLDHLPAKKLVHYQHEQNDHDHHPDQQVAELPDASPELRLGRARLDPRYDRSEGGPASGLDRQDSRPKV